MHHPSGLIVPITTAQAWGGRKNLHLAHHSSARFSVCRCACSDLKLKKLPCYNIWVHRFIGRPARSGLTPHALPDTALGNPRRYASRKRSNNALGTALVHAGTLRDSGQTTRTTRSETRPTSTKGGAGLIKVRPPCNPFFYRSPIRSMNLIRHAPTLIGT